MADANLSEKQVQDQIRIEAKKALRSGDVSAVVGWCATRFEDRTRPYFAETEEECDLLVWNRHCINGTAKFALDDRYPEKKLGIIARGCDSRALNRMMKDRQLKREDLYIIGVVCDGKEDPVCEGCQHKTPLTYDILIGEPVPETIDPDRFKEVIAFETLSADERYAYWAKQYDKCIHCYACRNACPACSCIECYADQYRTGWQGKAADREQNQVYGLTRAFHVGDRCIECGECERVCPMDLPIMRQTKKMLKDINELFGDYECGLPDDGTPILGGFRLEDPDEFM